MLGVSLRSAPRFPFFLFCPGLSGYPVPLPAARPAPGREFPPSAAGIQPELTQLLSESTLYSPWIIGIAILQSTVKIRKPIEKIAAPIRISVKVGVYS